MGIFGGNERLIAEKASKYFHGNLSLNAAQDDIMKDCPGSTPEEGKFLLRAIGSSLNKVMLCMVCNGEFTTHLLLQRENGWWAINETNLPTRDLPTTIEYLKSAHAELSWSIPLTTGVVYSRSYLYGTPSNDMLTEQIRYTKKKTDAKTRKAPFKRSQYTAPNLQVSTPKHSNGRELEMIFDYAPAPAVESNREVSTEFECRPGSEYEVQVTSSSGAFNCVDTACGAQCQQKEDSRQMHSNTKHINNTIVRYNRLDDPATFSAITAAPLRRRSRAEEELDLNQLKKANSIAFDFHKNYKSNATTSYNPVNIHDDFCRHTLGITAGVAVKAQNFDLSNAVGAAYNPIDVHAEIGAHVRSMPQSTIFKIQSGATKNTVDKWNKKDPQLEVFCHPIYVHTILVLYVLNYAASMMTMSGILYITDAASYAGSNGSEPGTRAQSYHEREHTPDKTCLARPCAPKSRRFCSEGNYRSSHREIKQRKWRSVVESQRLCKTKYSTRATQSPRRSQFTRCFGGCSAKRAANRGREARRGC